jgi:hypothetical protein
MLRHPFASHALGFGDLVGGQALGDHTIRKPKARSNTGACRTVKLPFKLTNLMRQSLS